MDALREVYLLLGPACNMSCRHCTQTPIKGTMSLTPCGGMPSDDVMRFLVEWGTQKALRSGMPRRLYFWGGEPLLYWQAIKGIILELEARGVTHVSHRLYTNGLLFNDEVAAFANAHNIWCIMSHDAPHPTALRNAVPSDRAVASFLKCKERTVNCVFSGLNPDMCAAFDYLEEKFPGTAISCGFINVLSPMDKDIYVFKKGVVKREVKRLFKRADEGDPWAREWFLHKWLRLDSSFEGFFDEPWPFCAPGRITLSVAFNGDVIRCHNDKQVLGHISEGVDALRDKHLAEWKRLLPKGCATCAHADLCRCICPIAVRKGKELCYCGYLREFWSAIKKCSRPRPEWGRTIGWKKVPLDELRKLAKGM